MSASSSPILLFETVSSLSSELTTCLSWLAIMFQGPLYHPSDCEFLSVTCEVQKFVSHNTSPRTFSDNYHVISKMNIVTCILQVMGLAFKGRKQLM